MKTFDVPQWVTESLLANGVTDEDYHLYGAGRALGFVRMAAYVLDKSAIGESIDFKEAEYHTYSGVSASRTAIDAVASWLNKRLQIGLTPSPRINLSREKFQKRVLAECPDIQQEVLSLGKLGSTVDKHRQRAQHREGLAIRFRNNSDNVVNQAGWYLAPQGLSGPLEHDLLLTELLGNWADQIEENAKEIRENLTPIGYS